MSFANTAREKGCVLFSMEPGYWTWTHDGRRVTSGGLFIYWPSEEEAAKAFLEYAGESSNTQ